jgi:pimeloyl-ACP methyl ester carboxylesterase
MARILIVPGLAVRSYAKPAAEALLRDGHDVSLLAAPAWRQSRTDPGDYGRMLAGQLDERAETVDLVVGLSVGTQVAAAAAAGTDRISRLLLISPTVDPIHRTFRKLTARWLKGDTEGDEERSGIQLHFGDWAQAGPRRIAAGFLAALSTAPLEEVLPRASADVMMVHAEYDVLSTPAWVRSLAIDDEHYRSMEHAPHSWPVDDEARFAVYVKELLA